LNIDKHRNGTSVLLSIKTATAAPMQLLQHALCAVELTCGQRHNLADYDTGCTDDKIVTCKSPKSDLFEFPGAGIQIR
jgi:hypothetical protein